MTSRLWLAVALLLGTTLFLFLLRRPAPVRPPVQTVLFSGTRVPTPVQQSFQRACQDCHSENTTWPWYSYLPVVSAVIKDDVTRGRQYLNVSQWDRYSRGQQRGYLVAIAAAVKKGEMPMKAYTFFHEKAQLSAAAIQVIADWARQENQRLRETQTVPASLH